MLKDPACGHIFRVKGFLQNPDGTWLEINATQQEITQKADCKRAGRSDCDPERILWERCHPGVMERLETDDDLCGNSAYQEAHSGLIRELELKEHNVCAV